MRNDAVVYEDAAEVNVIRAYIRYLFSTICLLIHFLIISCYIKNFGWLILTFSTESEGNNPNTPRACCYANTAECLSCGAGIGVDEYCRRYPSTIGCEGIIDIDGKF